MADDLPTRYCQMIVQHLRQVDPDATVPLTLHTFEAKHVDLLLERSAWATLQELFIAAAKPLQAAGVQVLVICGSALQPLGREVAGRTRLPLVDLGWAVRSVAERSGHDCFAVLGVRSARERDYWRNALGADRIVALTEDERTILSSLAGPEFDDGIQSRVAAAKLVSDLKRRGANVVVIADPALLRWINRDDSTVRVIDAAEIHAWAAAGCAVGPTGLVMPAPPCVVSDDPGWAATG